MAVDNPKIRPVIFVLPSLSPGGAERIVVNVANSLSDNNKIYIAEIRKGGNLSTYVQDNVVKLNLTNRFVWLFRILWYVYKLKPCCLVATNFDINASLLAIKWLLPKSCALVLREPVSIHATRSESKIPIIRYLVFKYLYRYTNTLVLLTNEMKNEFVQLCPEIAPKIKVVPNGVNLSRIKNTQNVIEKSEYREYLVTVCRLEYQKGLDVLISAFAKVKEKFPGYGLVVIGEGSQRANLCEQIKTLNLTNSVKLVGFVDNPSSLVKGASLFVLSSRYEGMSNAMLEALCLGVPVVAVKKHTAAGEILRENFSGFLVDECSIRTLEDALLQALGRLETINREKIALWARNEFSLSKMVDNYRDVFREYCAIQG